MEGMSDLSSRNHRIGTHLTQGVGVEGVGVVHHVVEVSSITSLEGVFNGFEYSDVLI